MNDEKKRARHKDRIYRVIRERPGITGTDLAKAAEYIDAIERRQIIDELIAEGKITVLVMRPGPGTKGGQPKKTYWPTEDTPSRLTQPEPHSSEEGFHWASVTSYECGVLNEDRRRLNTILAKDGKPLLPMLSISV